MNRKSSCGYATHFFRIINDFVHRFILDRTFVDFTVLLLILKLTTKIVKSTDLWSKINLCTKPFILRKINDKQISVSDSKKIQQNIS
jgi:hypothetical protein